MRETEQTMYPITIEKHGYTVVLHSPNRATVSGGRLPKPTGVGKLLGEGDLNPKTAKNEVVTMGLSLYPADGIGFGNVCPFAKVCVVPCLAHQGQGPVPSVAGARVAKTVLWYLAREWFLAKLNRELSRFREKYPPDTTVGVRLNMFSDIPWEHYGVIDANPGVSFYDYSKNPRRWGAIRPNYWVTFSFDGTNWEAAERILRAGGNVSVVFYEHGGKCGKAAHKQRLPASWRGFPAIDGGKTDWRPDDPRGVLVGLRLLARTYDSRNAAIDSGFAQLWATIGGVQYELAG
jgi:hypothetical protein